VIKILCLERLDISHILYAFQKGASEITVYVCNGKDCKYGKPEERILKRLNYIKGQLSQLQIDGRFNIKHVKD
jgi:coenzyme F420-reducing hydrogenase delta subunit